MYSQKEDVFYDIGNKGREEGTEKEIVVAIMSEKTEERR